MVSWSMCKTGNDAKLKIKLGRLIDRILNGKQSDN